MSHSHMPIKHLIKLLEQGGRDNLSRRARPDWLTQFIHDVAELFEPISDVGRVGFECRLADACWEVALFLGRTEMVGGPCDGQSRWTNYCFDIKRLLEFFSRIESCTWVACPQDEEDAQFEFRSALAVEGTVGEHPLRVMIHAVPPEQAGPGFREFPDGRCEPA